MLKLLTAPTAFGQPHNYRFMVQLASIKVDREGVRENYQVIDVVVSSPTKEAIATLLAATDRLQDYAIADYWIPEDCDQF